MWLHSFPCQGQDGSLNGSSKQEPPQSDSVGNTEKNDAEIHIACEKLQTNRLAKPANQTELKTTTSVIQMSTPIPLRNTHE